MAELFGVNVPAISKHLSNIFEDNELKEDSVISILETTATDGKKYKTFNTFFNFIYWNWSLGVDISVNCKNFHFLLD